MKMDIAAELKPVAEDAARVVGQCLPGDWIVIIYGTIDDNRTTTVGWQWFWHPPTETIPANPIDLK